MRKSLALLRDLGASGSAYRERLHCGQKAGVRNMTNRTDCFSATPAAAGSVFLATLCAAFASSRSPGAEATAWVLRTDDTELRLSVADQRPVIQRLAAVGSSHAWIDAPSTVALLNRVWRDGREMPLAWTFQQAAFDPTAGQLTLAFENAEPQLLLRSVWQARPGRGPVEHWLEVENRSAGRLTVAQQDSLSLRGLVPTGPATLWWIQRGGGNASTQGGTFSRPLAAGLDVRLDSNCDDGASPVPWLTIQTGSDEGLYVGWEFSGLGRIHARAAEGRAQPIDLEVGLPPDFKTDVEPGEVWLVPPAFVGCYRGDLDEGSYRLHRFVLEKLRPPLPPNCPDPILAYNLYLDVGGNRATEADVLRSARFCRDLGFEAFMPDAMWFPETGDWRWDPRRFPRGLQPIEEFVHGAGLKLALWCAWTNGGISADPEALSVRGPAGRPDWFNADYPADWKPGPFYGGQLCLACAEARAWAEQKTQWLVGQHHLDYLKHDINPIVTRCNKTNHRHRYGVDTSYWATLGYYQIQAKLRQAYPRLILENCSGGGHIKDFGVVRLTHYTVATDTLSNLPNRQAMYDSTFALPPLVLQCYTYDNYYPVRGDKPDAFLWRSAMLGAWQIDPTDTPRWSAEERAVARRSVEVYRQWIRPMLADVKVHHILPRPDGSRWDGMFYWSAGLRRGTLYVWRPDSPDARQTVRLKGLDPARRYWVWCEDGSLTPGVRGGEELLLSGLELDLPQAYTSDLIFVQDEALGKPGGLDVPAEFRLQEAAVKGGMFSVSARLSWEPAAGARSYRVLVAEDAEFRRVVAAPAVVEPPATVEQLPPERTLYWRVEGLSWGGRRISAGQPGTLITPRLARPAGLVFLSEIPWLKANAGADNPVRHDVNYYGQPIAINGKVYPKGLWTHAYPDATPADVAYDLADKKFELFHAHVGLDDASGGGSVQFRVLVDGEPQAESPVLLPRQVHRFRVSVVGAKQLTLRVLNGGDGYACDHAAWGAARLVAAGLRDPLEEEP